MSALETTRGIDPGRSAGVTVAAGSATAAARGAGRPGSPRPLRPIDDGSIGDSLGETRQPLRSCNVSATLRGGSADYESVTAIPSGGAGEFPIVKIQAEIEASVRLATVREGRPGRMRVLGAAARRTGRGLEERNSFTTPRTFRRPEDFPPVRGLPPFMRLLY